MWTRLCVVLLSHLDAYKLDPKDQLAPAYSAATLSRSDGFCFGPMLRDLDPRRETFVRNVVQLHIRAAEAVLLYSINL